MDARPQRAPRPRRHSVHKLCPSRLAAPCGGRRPRAHPGRAPRAANSVESRGECECSAAAACPSRRTACRLRSPGARREPQPLRTLSLGLCAWGGRASSCGLWVASRGPHAPSPSRSCRSAPCLCVANNQRPAALRSGPAAPGPAPAARPHTPLRWGPRAESSPRWMLGYGVAPRPARCSLATGARVGFLGPRSARSPRSRPRSLFPPKV